MRVSLCFAVCTAIRLFSGIPTYADTPITPAQPPPVNAALEPPKEVTSSADLTLGGEVILRLKGNERGATPQDRVDAVLDRLNLVLSHPDISASDVVVFTPKGASPEIYVLGRALISVDKESALGSGIGTPLQTAVVWAKRFQQILPLVDVRLNNEPEPTVPPNPPLLVTSNFSNVGGSDGEVDWNSHLIISLSTSPIPGVTPAEYCDWIDRRLAAAIDGAGAGPIVVTAVVPAKDPTRSVDVFINSTRLITASPAEAKVAGIVSPKILAEIWCGNLQAALTPTVNPASE